MKYILFVMVIMSDSTAHPPTFTTAEFNGREACEAAGKGMEEALHSMQSNILVTTRCFEKG